jgi:thioredoxin-like negative regulator of GroEL
MDRIQFIDALQENPGVLVVKFGASWCKPCAKIKPYLADRSARFPPHWKFMDLDVDKDTDLWALLQSKKQVRQIPVLLAYKAKNLTPYADKALVSSNPDDLDAFFEGLKLL